MGGRRGLSPQLIHLDQQMLVELVLPLVELGVVSYFLLGDVLEHLNQDRKHLLGWNPVLSSHSLFLLLLLLLFSLLLLH